MEEKLITTDKQDELMLNLGFEFDEEIGKFVLNGSVYLGDVPNDVNSISELISRELNRNTSSSYPSSIHADMVNRGMKLHFGPGGIDDYGKHNEKGLYCSNYKELFHTIKH